MWECANCGETVEDDFDVCWNCQTEKASLPSKDLWQQKSDKELITASEHLSDYTKGAEKIIRAELRRRRMPEPEPTIRTLEVGDFLDGSRSQKETKVETSNEELRRIDAYIKAANGDYLVIPFIGKIKTGLFSSENAETVSRQLQSMINEYSRQGWEFYNIAKVDIKVTPGCLASLFGVKTSYITFDQVVFRRARP